MIKSRSRADYPDREIQYKPASRGGGRKRNPPSAECNAGGQIVLNHEAAEMLGSPERVLVSVNPRRGQIFLRPTTPNNVEGGYSLAGGGNSPHRIGSRQLIRDYPLLVGKYTVGRAANGIVLVLVEHDQK